MSSKSKAAAAAAAVETVPLSALGRVSQPVYCTACRRTGRTVIIEKREDARHSAESRGLSTVLCGMLCGSTEEESILELVAHFCRSCGIRLAQYVVLTNESFIFLTEDMLVPAPEQEEGKRNKKDSKRKRVARSVFEQPPRFGVSDQVATETKIEGRTRALDLTRNQTTGLPTEARSTSTGNTVRYVVSKPNMTVRKFYKGETFLPFRLDDTVEAAEDFIDVYRGDEKGERVARIRFQNHNWEIQIAWGPAPEGEQDETWNTTLGIDHKRWSPSIVYAPFTSSFGPLIWTSRRIKSAWKDELVLVDAYDRVLGIGRSRPWDGIDLADATSDPRWLDEVAVSWIATQIQQLRVEQYDGARRRESGVETTSL